MKKTTIFISFLFIISGLFSQEIITDLSVNPSLIKHYKEYSKAKSRTVVVRKLPFYDDFSDSWLYPVDSLWQNRNTFVNSNFAVNPPSMGVVTFDVLNDTGSVYGSAGAFTFPADTLTSQIIRLDSILSSNPKALSPADSVYLSFYYQPQGLGNSPEAGDSLALEFYYYATDSWIWQWSVTGSTLQAFYDSNQVWFKQVFIPVLDSIFFNSQFQFRFRNYGSIASNSIPSWGSNSDQWNIDNIYLNYNRNIHDSSVLDYAIVNPLGSLLKNYTSMPWNQFKLSAAAEMTDTVKIIYNNLSNNIKNVDQRFRITDLSGTSSAYITNPPIITNVNMPGLSNHVFNHLLSYTFNSNSTPYADFEVYFNIGTGAELKQSNNTSIYYQKFYNYYAYDDGSPEAGYGLTPNGARLAYQFQLNQPDSLQSVQIFFNQILNPTTKYFYLTVWNDNNGKPGSVIYEKSGTVPIYENGLNEFHTYYLTHPVYVSGTFYVGWRQTSADNLNVGFDMNTNAKSHVFYNVDGSWNNSIFNGSLMIRPILGSLKDPILNRDEIIKNEMTFTIYPNPASGNILNISTENDFELLNNESIIEVFDIRGRLIHRQSYSNSVDISELSNGLFILRISDIKQNIQYNHKFIINR